MKAQRDDTARRGEGSGMIYGARGARRGAGAGSAFRWLIALVMYRNASITHEYLSKKYILRYMYNVAEGRQIVRGSNKYITKNIMSEHYTCNYFSSVNKMSWTA